MSNDDFKLQGTRVHNESEIGLAPTDMAGNVRGGARHNLGGFLLSATFGLLAACGGGGGGDSPTAASVNIATLSWNAVTDPTLGGYLVYFGTTSGIYPNLLPVSKDSTSFVVSGLDSGTRYYFAAAAYNAQGQSVLSNEVFKDIP